MLFDRGGAARRRSRGHGPVRQGCLACPNPAGPTKKAASLSCHHLSRFSEMQRKPRNSPERRMLRQARAAAKRRERPLQSRLSWSAFGTHPVHFFPKSHGKPRVDDRRVLSGIIFINRNGLRWRDVPAAYGPHKTLYNRWKRLLSGMCNMLAGQRERQGHLCTDDGRSGRRPLRREDRYDRCGIPEGTPHRDQHGRQKGG